MSKDEEKEIDMKAHNVIQIFSLDEETTVGLCRRLVSLYSLKVVYQQVLFEATYQLPIEEYVPQMSFNGTPSDDTSKLSIIFSRSDRTS